ncbi:ornithine cyclodeaminase family protein [Kribbella sp. NPDC051952]|uniref:ornithine cyclodeaminase family protein n=1 Tax=Kribbella sp. NPDC051952 TaxID=3154851 RepID=UPI0034218374
MSVAGTASRPILALSRAEIAKTLEMSDVIEVVEQAHAALSTGDAVQAERSAIEVPGSTTLLVPMTAAIAPQGVAGIKLLTDTPANAERSLPVQQSTVVLVDAETGSCEAILDGPVLTLFRTAAASAVATRHLARPDSRTLGLVGAGAQARAHLDALSCVLPIDKVVVWSRSRSTVEAFAAYARERVAEVIVAEGPEEVIRTADVLCTLTPSREPLVRGEWFEPGLHVNAVGAPPRPDHREIDTEGIVRSLVVVDSYDVARRESGEVLVPLSEGAITAEHFRTELGDVITGARKGRRTDDDVTLYDSVGLGIQDVAAARLAVDAARRTGLGVELRLR